jgi:hypothetical protein
MIFNLSTGLQKSVIDELSVSLEELFSDTVSFTATQILDTGKFSGFARHDLVRVRGGANAGVTARVISGDSDQLTFAAGTFSVESAGSARLIEKISTGGSYSIAMTNGVIHLYSSPMPIDADAAEGAAVLLAVLTRNALPFAAGVSENGLNLEWDAASKKAVRAVDPETGIREVWSGAGIAVGTVTWGRYYGNSHTLGASTTARRIDGDAGDTASSFFYMPNGRAVVVGGPVTVTEVGIGAKGVA